MKNWKEIIFSEKDKYSFKPEVQIILFGLLVCLASLVVTDVSFFGHKTTAIFDIWTLVHVATGAVLGYFAIIMRGMKFHHPIMLLLLISFGWEIAEHYIELSNLPYLSEWFGGQESIENRLIADQIAVVLGFFLIKWNPKFLPVALFIAVGILAVHIGLGDSMYFFK